MATGIRGRLRTVCLQGLAVCLIGPGGTFISLVLEPKSVEHYFRARTVDNLRPSIIPVCSYDPRFGWARLYTQKPIARKGHSIGRN